MTGGAGEHGKKTIFKSGRLARQRYRASPLMRIINASPMAEGCLACAIRWRGMLTPMLVAGCTAAYYAPLGDTRAGAALKELCRDMGDLVARQHLVSA